MPVNRNALIRYKTIDKCLQNRHRKWTLPDLIEACSEALYEFEGIDKGVSRRTVQGDIQVMRSDKLGYNAPIVVREKKFYTYSDPEYSITNIPLSENDLGMLTEAVDFLKQFQGFSHFQNLDGMVQKLEDHIHSQKTHTRPVIDFEKNDNLKGLEFLDPLYRAVIHRRPLLVSYQSFRARMPSDFEFHPILLKEFRNRWFIIGVKNRTAPPVNLALDRIAKLSSLDKPYIERPDFDPESHFHNAIGVSVSPNMEVEEVRLFVTHRHAPYVLTKPLHHSQTLLERNSHGITIALRVQHNFELEKAILAFGDGMQVIAPVRLRHQIRSRLDHALDLYNTELSGSGLSRAVQRLAHKGFAVLNQVYTQRNINQIKRLIDQQLVQGARDVHAVRGLLQKVSGLKQLLFVPNLLRIIRGIDQGAFLVKSMYFDKAPESNWYVTWHQDVAINVREKKEAEGYGGWTEKEGAVGVCPPIQVSRNIFTLRIHLDDTNADNGCLRVLAGSHKQALSPEAIKLITENSMPSHCEVAAGGIQLMKPLLLHASSKSQNDKRRRVIHLEFASQELAEGLEWAEREAVPVN